jgi:hypothetical protein
VSALQQWCVVGQHDCMRASDVAAVPAARAFDTMASEDNPSGGRTEQQPQWQYTHHIQGTVVNTADAHRQLVAIMPGCARGALVVHCHCCHLGGACAAVPANPTAPLPAVNTMPQCCRSDERCGASPYMFAQSAASATSHSMPPQCHWVLGRWYNSNGPVRSQSQGTSWHSWSQT